MREIIRSHLPVLMIFLMTIWSEKKGDGEREGEESGQMSKKATESQGDRKGSSYEGSGRGDGGDVGCSP